MKILIVVAGCLKVNSSANLCHRAYIQGFVDNGDDVTVISISEEGQIIDETIKMPSNIKHFMFRGTKIIGHISSEKRKALNKEMENGSVSVKTKIFTLIRNLVLKLYGPFGHQIVWVNNVVKKYKGENEFDLVISLSSPVTSHIAAYKLIKKAKIKCNRFCEIWEDPWQYDIYKESINKKYLDLEHKITTYSDKVLYVSPITLEIQKNIFKDSSIKMDWLPLPYYYKDKTMRKIKEGSKTYGYFGDYFPKTRNLEPFYKAAKELGVTTNICGMPNTLFEKDKNINITERLSLNELKKYEDITDVLVFICNLKGGQIPGKIYQYSATNKYILFILDGTESEKKIIKEYFSKFNRYVFCENTIEDIKQAITLIELNKVKNLKNECVDYFEPKNIAKQIIEKCK